MRDYDAWLNWDIASLCNLKCDYCCSGQNNNTGKPAGHPLVRLFNDKKTLTKILHNLSRTGLRASFIALKTALREKNHGFAEIDIPALIHSLNEKRMVFKITFAGGGEPLMVPNIVEACKALTKNHFVGLTTNLIPGNAVKFAKEIDSSRVDTIVASLHIQELTRRHLTTRFIENYRLFQLNGFHIWNVVVAHPTLAEKAEEHKAIFKKNGIMLNFIPFIGIYQGKTYPEAYTERELKALNLDKMEEMRVLSKGRLCTAGYTVADVSPTGYMQSCRPVAEPLGNIYGKFEFKKEMMVCPKNWCGCPYFKYDTYLYEKGLAARKTPTPVSSVHS